MQGVLLCVGLLALADPDSGAVEGCGRSRLPDVDAPERGAPCYAEITASARALADGRWAAIRLDAEPDRYGRHVTSPDVAGLGDLRETMLAERLVVVRRYDGRWLDPAPTCEDLQ